MIWPELFIKNTDAIFTSAISEIYSDITEKLFKKNLFIFIGIFYPSGKLICFVAAHLQYMNTASYAAPCISTCE